MSDRGLDWQRVAVSTLVTATLAVALAAALLHRSSTTPDVGPTSAALEDGFSILLGACIGLLIGSAATALLARRGSSMLAGLVAGTAAYWLAFVPYLALIGPTDVTIADYVFGLLIFFIPAAAFIIVGAAVGTAFRPQSPAGEGADPSPHERAL